MNFIRKMTQKNARNSSDCSTSNNSENDILFQTSTIHRPIVALQRADECSRLVSIYEINLYFPVFNSTYIKP